MLGQSNRLSAMRAIASATTLSRGKYDLSQRRSVLSRNEVDERPPSGDATRGTISSDGDPTSQPKEKDEWPPGGAAMRVDERPPCSPMVERSKSSPPPCGLPPPPPYPYPLAAAVASKPP